MKIKITHSPLHFPIAEAEGLKFAVFCIVQHEEVILCLNPRYEIHPTTDHQGRINGYNISVNKPHNLSLIPNQKPKEEVVTENGKYSIKLLQLIPRADIQGYEVELDIVPLNN